MNTLVRLPGEDTPLAQSRNVDDAKRTETLARALRHDSTMVITLVAGMLVLDLVGLPLAPILATAGVAGIAIAFSQVTPGMRGRAGLVPQETAA